MDLEHQLLHNSQHQNFYLVQWISKNELIQYVAKKVSFFS